MIFPSYSLPVYVFIISFFYLKFNLYIALDSISNFMDKYIAPSLLKSLTVSRKNPFMNTQTTRFPVS